MSPYEILGVSPNTSLDDCKKAYRKLCAKYHPDNGGSPDMFDKVNKAWNMIQSGVSTIESFVTKRSSLKHQTLFTFVSI